MSQCAICLVRSPDLCIAKFHREWEKRRGFTNSFVNYIGHDNGTVTLEVGMINDSRNMRTYRTEDLA